jgi:hypothetical protein
MARKWYVTDMGRNKKFLLHFGKEAFREEAN